MDFSEPVATSAAAADSATLSGRTRTEVDTLDSVRQIRGRGIRT